MLQDELCERLLSRAVTTHPLFAKLPQGALWKVVVILQHDVVRAGSALITNGMPTSSLYFLKDGYCDLECWELDARTNSVSKKTRIVNDGASFGEYAALGLYPTSMVTVTTRTSCTFDRLQQDALFAAFSGLPGVLADMRARIGIIAPNGCRIAYN